ESYEIVRGVAGAILKNSVDHLHVGGPADRELFGIEVTVLEYLGLADGTADGDRAWVRCRYRLGKIHIIINRLDRSPASPARDRGYYLLRIAEKGIVLEILHELSLRGSGSRVQVPDSKTGDDRVFDADPVHEVRRVSSLDSCTRIIPRSAVASRANDLTVFDPLAPVLEASNGVIKQKGDPDCSCEIDDRVFGILAHELDVLGNGKSAQSH